jgi:hypothetical protein
MAESPSQCSKRVSDRLNGGTTEVGYPLMAVGFEFRGERIPLTNPQRALAPGCNAAADPGYLFPRYFSRSVSAHHPDIHRGLAPRAVTS